MSEIAFAIGYVLSLGGGYAGAGIPRGQTSLQPSQPLIALATVAILSNTAAVVGGFWLFGWTWAGLFLPCTAAGGWIGDRIARSAAAAGLAPLSILTGLPLLAWGALG